MGIITKGVNAIRKYATDPVYRFELNQAAGMYDKMSDEAYLRKAYRVRMGKELNLDNPQTFCEKLQWLKLYDHNPRYTMLADKYEVKKIVADAVGEQYVLPAFGVWDSFDEIDFDTLPDQFILKCTHNSGGFMVCRDKNTFDKEEAKKLFDKLLKTSYFLAGREWVYKDIKPRIIAEPYIDTLGEIDSIEYKLTCFDGVAKNITICTGIAHSAYENRTNDNFDRELNHLPWYAYYKNAAVTPEIPPQMDEIIEIAEKLSKDIPQVRVDFYVIDGQVYFGEMTFYTWSGFIEFTPPEWDDIMGSYIDLEKVKH